MFTKLYQFSDSGRINTTVYNSAGIQFGNNSKMTQSDSELSESIDADDSDTGSGTGASNSTTTTSASGYTTTQTDDEDDNNNNDGSQSLPDNENEQNVLELAQIGNALLRLPRDLCENREIFKEFFSMDTWNMLPLDLQQILIKMLPNFTKTFNSADEANAERQKTVEMLFNNELQSFGFTPLQLMQLQLETGNYRPDVVKLRKSIAKSTRREQRFQTCERLSHLARELFIKRERLLRNVYKSAAPLGSSEPIVMPRQNAFNNLCTDTKMYVVRARQRYAQEVEQLLKLVGLQTNKSTGPIAVNEHELSANDSDENAFGTQQLFRTPIAGVTGSNLADKCIYGTLFKRRHNLNDEDSLYQQQHAKHPRLNHKNFRHYLQTHKRRKFTEPNLPEFDIADIRLRDVCTRAQMGGNFKRIFATMKTPGRKPKKYKLNGETAADSLQVEPNAADKTNDDDISYDMLDADDVEFQQEEVVATNYIIPTQLTTSTITKTPINANIQQLQTQPQQQQQRIIRTTIDNNNVVLPKLQPLHKNNLKSLNMIPTSFFSLIRDFFCETTHHRLQLGELQEKLERWLRQPVNQLNTDNNWYALIENWSGQLSSAIDFLCGEFLPLPEEYVPYVEYKTQANIYQWIGAGRDSDVRLAALCQYWLQRRQPTTTITKFLQPTINSNNKIITTTTPTTSSAATTTIVATTTTIANTIHITITTMAAPTTTTPTTTTTLAMATTTTAAVIAATTTPAEHQISTTTTATDNMPPPPPARCATNWTVRAASVEEIKEFQRQEKARFEQPHRSYTYRMHGYESVVGPVKGIYSEIYAMTKARGHSMMVGDRPNFVTILTLVRDAVARLPNGEGTRADIAELVKSSQYLNHNAAENVLQTIVSGALDRMHTESDPCVRYDPKRKIWIYLHRHRSEEEFERIHQQQQLANKGKKTQRKHNSKKAITSTATLVTTPTTAIITTTTGAATVGIKTIITTTPTLAQTTSITNNRNNMLSQPPPLASVSDTCPLPALVPANSSIGYNQQQQLLKQKQILLKCPPVPPLKYHIPPTAVQQQQKSLLKARNIDDQQQQQPSSQQQQQRILVRTVASTAGGGGVAVAQTDINDVRKLSPQQQQQKSSQITLPRTLASKLSAKTPILVATPTGLQAVHMSNATNVVGGATGSGIIVTPTMGGKKLALSKPIIINQITKNATTPHGTQQQQQLQQQTLLKNKSIKQQQQQQQQQQQAQSFIIPLNDGLVQSVDNKTPQTSGVQAMFIDNIGQITTQQQQTQPQQQQQQNKNIIRLMPSGITTTTAGTSAQIQKKLTGTPVQIMRQQKSPTTATTPTAMTGLSIITANRNSTGGTIVKMTPQAFAVLQQQQQQQQQQQGQAQQHKQQHIILKPANMLTTQQQQQPTRIIVGNPTITTGQHQQQQQQHQHQHGLMQTLTPISVNNSTISIATTTTSISSNNSNNNNNLKKGMQTLTATSLSPQQQRFLLQNLKQQKQKQQQQQITKTSIAATIVATTHNKSQQQPQQQQYTQNIARAGTTPTRILTSTTGQIISLEDLLQKQRGGKQQDTTATTTTMPQIVTLTSQQQQQQQQQHQQFGIVVSPTTRGIISINPANIVGSTTTTNTTTGTVTAAASANNLNKIGTISTATSNTIPAFTINKSTTMSATTPTKTILSGGRVLTMAAPSGSGGAGNIRIINTTGATGGTTLTGLNFTNLQGKQVVFATKQNQQLQNAGVVIGGQALKMQGNVNVGSGTQLQTVIVGNQILRLQQLTGQTQNLKATTTGGTINRLAFPLAKSVATSAAPGVTTTTTAVTNLNVSLDNIGNDSGNASGNNINSPKTLVLGGNGKTLQLQTGSKVTAVKGLVATSNSQQHSPNTTVATTMNNNVLPTSNRVVLAVQGGSPFILPAGTFPGGTINLKSLQNMKLVSIAPSPATTTTNVKEPSSVPQPQASL